MAYDKEERAEIVKKYEAGASFGGIARELGTSVGTIAGIIHRAGVKISDEQRQERNRHKLPPNGAKRRQTTLERVAARKPPRMWKSEYQESAAATAVSILRACSCRYPIGDATDPDFRFCMAETGAPTSPYCKEHMQIVFRPREQK